MKIAVFCPNWVGDMVMATPALRGIRRYFSMAEVVAVVRPYVAEVLDGLDLVDRVLLHDPSRRRRLTVLEPESSWGWQFARRLRKEKFDLAVVLPNSFRSAYWAWMSGAKRRVGFQRDGRGWLLTDSLVPRPRDVPHPVIDEYLRLATHLGCEDLTRIIELAASSTHERQLREFWKRQRLDRFAARGVVCLNPGGAFGAAQHWPTTSYAQLALRLAAPKPKSACSSCADRRNGKKRAKSCDWRGTRRWSAWPMKGSRSA